jgi:hypothetical protein
MILVLVISNNDCQAYIRPNGLRPRESLYRPPAGELIILLYQLKASNVFGHMQLK